MNSTTQSDKLLSRKEAAARLGLKVTTLEVWASRGRSDLPYIRCGYKCMYSESDIEAYIRRRRACSATAHRALEAASAGNFTGRVDADFFQMKKAGRL